MDAWPYFADVEDGLSDVAADELTTIGATVAPQRGGLLVSLGVGSRRRGRPVSPALELLTARTVGAVHRRLAFAVPRPKSLLGSQHLLRLTAAVAEVVSEAREPFSGLRVAAAGADSDVMRRLAGELARAAGVAVDPAAGDLVVRVFPAAKGVWEVHVRLTPRPLSTRPWRVCNLPGGVNATVAVAMNRLAGEAEGDRYLNLMCGSGTLVIERSLSATTALELTGVDVSQRALSCAAENEAAARDARSGRQPPATWRAGDVRDLDLGSNSFDVVTADAPWGDAIGEHAESEAVHAALLDCAARHTGSGARFALLSHEVKVLQGLLALSHDWRTVDTRRVSHGGHRPVLALLERV